MCLIYRISDWKLSLPIRIITILVAAAGLDQLVGLGLGQLGVVAGLHSVVTTALSLGTQVGSVAEHLSQRHIGVDLVKARSQG